MPRKQAGVPRSNKGILRSLRIENYYGGKPIITHAKLRVPTAKQLQAKGRTWDDFKRDELFKLTGTGRTTGESAYVVDSVDGLKPKIHETYGF